MSNTNFRVFRTPNSSVIKSLTLDCDSENLHIKFKSGKTYTYHGVSQWKFTKMCKAPSVGSYYNKRIKGQYPCTGARQFMLESQLNWMLTR